VVRVGLPTQPQSWAGWDRCPNGRLLPGELWLAAAKSHPVTTAVGAPRADALAEKLPPRAWQRLPAPAPKVTAGMSGPAPASAMAPAIHDDSDLGMTVLAQGGHSTVPSPAGPAGPVS
jgi:hypothetical protein